MSITENKILIPKTLDEVMTSSNLWFTLTNRCNLTCQYCFNYCKQKIADMSPDLAIEILDYYLAYQKKLKLQHPYLHLIFFGGEPTLNPQTIRAVVNYVNQNRIDCLLRLITNGMIDDDFLEWLIAERVYLQISFDGFVNNLRVGHCGNYAERILKTINRLKANTAFPYSLHATIHAGNVENMAQIVEFAAEHRASNVAFCPVCLEGNALSHGVKRPTIAQYVDNYFKALATAKKCNIGFYSVELMMQRQEILQKKLPLIWLPDGSLALCDKYLSSSQAGADAAIIGKYSTHTKTFTLYEEVLTKISNNFFNKRKECCASCTNYKNCQGLSSFVAYSLQHNSNDKFMCETRRKIVEKLNQTTID